jgi:hypothetical protein
MATFRLGTKQMRGLPFLVGSANAGASDRCQITLGGDDVGVTIPIDASAHRVIVAHCLVESTVAEDGRWGRPVADYVFRLSGGREERVRVRERFEIGTTPGVGQIPGGDSTFRAVTDGKTLLFPRNEGPWGNAGWRQLENRGPVLHRYWLWPWVNPDPEQAVESLEVVPLGPWFVIAGITLGHVDEHPFAREGMRPARIVLIRPEDAGKPFDLEV